MLHFKLKISKNRNTGGNRGVKIGFEMTPHTILLQNDTFRGVNEGVIRFCALLLKKILALALPDVLESCEVGGNTYDLRQKNH